MKSAYWLLTGIALVTLRVVLIAWLTAATIAKFGVPYPSAIEGAERSFAPLLYAAAVCALCAAWTPAVAITRWLRSERGRQAARATAVVLTWGAGAGVALMVWTALRAESSREQQQYLSELRERAIREAREESAKPNQFGDSPLTKTTFVPPPLSSIEPLTDADLIPKK